VIGLRAGERLAGRETTMITRLRDNRGLALLLVATMAGGGCVSVRVRSAEPVAGQGSRGRVEVNVFDTAGARKSGVRTARTIVSELFRREGLRKVDVREFREASWAAADLPPGRYTVRVRHWVDEQGKKHRLSSSDADTFALTGGERVRVDVVLRSSTPVLAGTAAVVGVLVLAGLVVSNIHINVWSNTSGGAVH
jgi:hypothetical protein